MHYSYIFIQVLNERFYSSIRFKYILQKIFELKLLLLHTKETWLLMFCF